MNIQFVLNTVDETIEKFKSTFPELVPFALFDERKTETIEAIKNYQKKLLLINKESIRKELEKYLITAEEIINEGFDTNSDERTNADNILVGMLEMAWIKVFLEQLNEKTIETEISEIKKFILEEFDCMDKEGWKYAFINENDYQLFVDILTNYFEQKEYNLPENTIKLKRNTKTKLAPLLNEIHKKSNSNSLKSDTKYFEIIKTLSHFDGLSNDEIYRTITR